MTAPYGVHQTPQGYHVRAYTAPLEVVMGTFRAYPDAENYRRRLEHKPPLRKVAAFDVTDYGIEHHQFFQGHGLEPSVALLDRLGYDESYDHAPLGCGDTFAEALDDALESAAQSVDDLDCHDLEQRIKADCGDLIDDPTSAYGEFCTANGLDDEDEVDGCEFHYYVGLRLKM